MRILLLLCALLLQPLSGRALADEAVPMPPPKDPALIEYYLLTVARGPHMEALFGHTILRIVDKNTNRDLAFNWGIFDFTDPLFPWKFYLGNLNYSLAISDSEALIDYYRNVEHRGIIQDHLVLTPKQKGALYSRLAENARPENIHYRYSQLRDNCSTRPRDHLDFALGGVLRAFFAKRPANLTYRDHIMHDATPVWWVLMGLDMGSNDVLDGKMTDWDEMFMPDKLRSFLTLVPALDDNHKPIFEHRLLESPEVIIDAAEPPAGVDPYQFWAVVVGGVVMVLAFGATYRAGEGKAAVLLGLMSIIFGLWSALWGTLFTLNWLISTYIELQHNALLWLMMPVDWLFVAYGVVVLFTKKRPARLSWLARAVRFLASIHLTALAIVTALSLTHVIHQTVLPMLASTGLIGLLYYGTMIRHAAAREP